MVEQPVPDDILRLAQERATARSGRDWPTADELKTRIEAAGWRVVDDGVDFRLTPARPPDLVVDGQTLYGAVESVPSRLDEPASAAATVVLLAGSDAGAVDATLDALAEHPSDDTEVLVVADRDAPISGPTAEVIRGVERFSPGDALQAALHRSRGALIVVLEPGRIPTADIVLPLRDALADPSVAVVGSDGRYSVDLRRFRPADSGDVTALGSGCYAFRRADVPVHGPIDGRLRLASSVATWWSLVLRDSGPDGVPRRAVAMELPLETVADGATSEADPRLARRDAYRIADLIGDHEELAGDSEEVAGVPGEGPQHDHQNDHAHHSEHAAEA